MITNRVNIVMHTWINHES